MSKSVKIKVCCLTREADIEGVLAAGADYCGFIVYPKSPRAVTLERATELSQQVPKGKRVLVDVAPSPERLMAYAAAGFDFFQLHFGLEVPEEILAAWADCVGRERLWLAPRLPPGTAFPEAVLQYADTILLDTYSKGHLGGTGETGDWAAFAALKQAHPETRWILAGGLNPENLEAAIASSGAKIVDVNSGVESAPGLKDVEKVRALFRE